MAADALPVQSPPSPSASVRAAERELLDRLRGEVMEYAGDRGLPRLRLDASGEDRSRVRAMIASAVEGFERAAAMRGLPFELGQDVQARLYDALLGYGPVQPLMDDPSVEEIFINSATFVSVVRDGLRELADAVRFPGGEAEVRGLAQTMLGTRYRLDTASPMVDGQLPDGSRFNIVIPPITRGTTITIRKFLVRSGSLDELVALGTLPPDAAAFLAAAVAAGVHILVSGGTGSGKTTLLRALCSSLADLPDGGMGERLTTAEETPELGLGDVLPDVVEMEARPANLESRGEIPIRALVRNMLRQRPTRIVIGEMRDAVALDFLKAMNTGHDGSMSTLHANSPRDALDRLVGLAMEAGERVPLEELQRMVVRAAPLVVQLGQESRVRARAAGRRPRRLVSEIMEVTGWEPEAGVVQGQALWEDPELSGRLRRTRVSPYCLVRIRRLGVPYDLPPPDGGRPSGEAAP